MAFGSFYLAGLISATRTLIILPVQPNREQLHYKLTQTDQTRSEILSLQGSYLSEDLDSARRKMGFFRGKQSLKISPLIASKAKKKSILHHS